MPSGGHARSGPPPDPNALRRDRDGEWLHLPAAGREGDPPAWPLVDPTDREIALWAIEWRRPQALAWERHGLELEVALYVRTVKDAEDPRATAAVRVLVQRYMDSLGLTLGGQHRNRWVIDDAPAQPAAKRGTSSAKDRLKVLRGGA